MIRLLRYLLAFFACILLATSALGQTRVPSGTGWYAALKAAPASDGMLLLSGGDSYPGVLKVARKFKAGHPLVIDGMGTAILRGGFNLQSAENVTLRNLKIVGTPGHGIQTGSGAGLVFEHVDVDAAKGTGFFIGGTQGFRVSYCSATNCGRGPLFHGLYASNNASGGVIEHSTFSGNAVSGIQFNGPGDTRDMTVTDCTLSGNGWTGNGAAFNVIKATNVTATDVRVIGNLSQGVSCTSGATVTFSGEVRFNAGKGGKCFNASNGAVLTLGEGVTVQMGTTKTSGAAPWYDSHAAQIVGTEGVTVLPVATGAEK